MIYAFIVFPVVLYPKLRTRLLRQVYIFLVSINRFSEAMYAANAVIQHRNLSSFMAFNISN